MSLGFPTKTLREGSAVIIIPVLDEEWENEQQARSKAPVFYNPVMKMNRDSAVLALKTHQAKLKRSVNVCEPLCGSGVRGVRLALEVPEVEKVVMGDLNPNAIRLGEENARVNDVSSVTEFRLLDANLLLSLHAYPGGRFDYVDIDPYGSPTPFLDTAIRATKNHGLIAATATDMAPLCGVNPKACMRKYGGMPLQGGFCHETAVRLLLGSMVKQGAIHEIAVKPVFSYYADHYIRAFAICDRGARKADKLIDEMGFIHYCPGCLYRETSNLNESIQCEYCGSEMKTGGPLFLGKLAETKFCEELIEQSRDASIEDRLIDIISLVKEETRFPPTFFIIDEICSLIGSKSIPTDTVFSLIENAGFTVTRTHFHDRGIKTDASIRELEKILSK